jgi:hypothetical protein
MATATLKQVDLITKLAAERVAPEWVKNLLLVLKPNSTDIKAASRAISELFNAPRIAAIPPITARPGFYLLDGEVYRVKESQENAGRFYAMRMVLEGNKGTWTYSRGVIQNLTPETRITVEQAAELGRRFGCCMICGRTLTDAKSVDAGIGPICEKKLAA